MSGEAKQVVSASSLRGQTRHTITNPDTGNTFVIREVWARDLYIEGSVPAPPSGAVPVGTVDVESLRRFEVALLRQGVVEPRIVESGGDDDSIEVRELPRSDREFLLAELVVKSGLLPEGVQADAESFRGEAAP
jgi:hypothetical protein